MDFRGLIKLLWLKWFLNSFPNWTLSQTLSKALKTLWTGSSKLQTSNLAWKVPFMYSFSIRQFIWEYQSGKKVPFMYSFSFRQFIWEHIGLERKFPLCIRFQLGNSFGNTKVERKFTLCIRFQLGNSFVNTTVPRKFTLCIRFQFGNSFGNT